MHLYYGCLRRVCRGLSSHKGSLCGLSRVLGRRVLGRCVLLGRLLLGHCLLGRRLLGHCVLGRLLLGHCLLGRRVLGRRLLGRRLLGHCLLGRRLLGHCLLGRRFLGRRLLDCLELRHLSLQLPPLFGRLSKLHFDLCGLDLTAQICIRPNLLDRLGGSSSVGRSRVGRHRGTFGLGSGGVRRM